MIRVTTPPPERPLDAAHLGPGGDDDHDGPDRGGEEGPEHPEARGGQPADRHHREENARDVPAARPVCHGADIIAEKVGPPPANPGGRAAERIDAIATTPFRIAVPDSVLADLRERLARTRFPDQAPGAPWAYGADLGYVRGLCG